MGLDKTTSAVRNRCRANYGRRSGGSWASAPCRNASPNTPTSSCVRWSVMLPRGCTLRHNSLSRSAPLWYRGGWCGYAVAIVAARWVHYEASPSRLAINAADLSSRSGERMAECGGGNVIGASCFGLLRSREVNLTTSSRLYSTRRARPSRSNIFYNRIRADKPAAKSGSALNTERVDLSPTTCLSGL